MNNLSQLYNVVEYTLSSNGYDSVEIEEPIGWTDDLFQVKRSTKNYSVITTYSTNLEFILSGYDFIKKVYKEQGFDADITITKKSIHHTESRLNLDYKAILNGYIYKDEDSKIKVNTIESKLNSLIATYKGDTVEINNTDSLDGTDIGELKIDNCLVEGKNILLVTDWVRHEDQTVVSYSNGSNPVIPLLNTKNSDEQASDVPPETKSVVIAADGLVENLFYSLATQDRTLNLSLDFDISLYLDEDIDGNTDGYFELVLVTYEDTSGTGGTQWSYLNQVVLATSTVPSTQNQNLILNDLIELQPLTGQSYGLYIKNVASNSDFTTTYNKTALVLSEDSFYEETHAQVVLPFELFERLLRIITGRTDLVLESNYFGRTDLGYETDGLGAYLGVSTGFWARDFKDEPLSISWNDAIESFSTVLNISYSIEQRGTTEYVKIEPLEHFFNDNVFTLPFTVDDLKLSTSSKYSFSSINIGFAKGGEDYDEAIGLDEPNGQHTYTSPITKNEMKFTKLSKIRGDMTGFEFARRKPQLYFGTEDTSYDNDNFFMDMKKGDTEILLQRKYTDDFTTISGIYSPETATNLRLSPKQLLLRHGWFINNGMTKYKAKDIHYVSSIGNSRMILDGVREDSNYLISDLDLERFINIDVEFTLPTSLSLSKEILDNIYSKIEFRDSKGNKYRFRLFDFSKNKYKGLLIDGL